MFAVSPPLLAQTIMGNLFAPARKIAMEYVVLPGTSLRVSRVCLGTMQFSGSAENGTDDVTWGSMSQDAVIATVHAALDCGINFFDCAEAYGKDNTAERALGAALIGRRSEAVIATKFGKHKPLWVEKI